MSFSNDKRNYLHSKLDEVIRLWFRKTGQGYFNLVVNDGEPEFQHGVYLDGVMVCNQTIITSLLCQDSLQILLALAMMVSHRVVNQLGRKETG